MKSTRHTGGVKEFGDTGPLGDTDSTRRFKEAYDAHLERKNNSKYLQIGWVRFLIAIIILVYVIYYFLR